MDAWYRRNATPSASVQWTDFTRHFTHIKSGEAANDKTLLLTAILSDAINLGLTKMEESCPGMTYAKLSWLQAWHIPDALDQLRPVIRLGGETAGLRQHGRSDDDEDGYDRAEDSHRNLRGWLWHRVFQDRGVRRLLEAVVVQRVGPCPTRTVCLRCRPATEPPVAERFGAW